MNPIIWVLIACFCGSLLGYISKWLSGGIVGWKAFAQDVLTGLIAAAVFAGAYQINQGVLTVLDCHRRDDRRLGPCHGRKLGQEQRDAEKAQQNHGGALSEQDEPAKVRWTSSSLRFGGRSG